MTLRIFVEAHGGVVALHGWLTAAEVEEVQKAVAAQGPSPQVDLASLAGVDEEGLQALKRLEQNGTSLTGAKPYIALLLGGTVAVGPGEPDE
jgi:hypothetical protein